MMTLLTILTSGLLAALLMGLVGFFLQYLGLHRADMITSVGTLFTHEPKRALSVGWLVQLTFGALFALAYAFVWSYLDHLTFGIFLLVGAITGFIHGLVVSIMLVIEIAEHHPNPAYRNIGFTIALSYIGTHVIYGLALGYLLGTFQTHYEVISHVAAFRLKVGVG